MITLKYDKERDTLEVRFSEKEIAESEYLEDIGIVGDYDQNDCIVALEILFLRKEQAKRILLEAILRGE